MLKLLEPPKSPMSGKVVNELSNIQLPKSTIISMTIMKKLKDLE